MHIPIEFYVRLPVELYRGGTPTRPKFNYLRTSPPRKENQKFDVKIDSNTGLISHRTGGLSLFNKPDYSFGPDWWVIKAGTKLPSGFTLSKDLANGKFMGHYSIRSLSNISEKDWKQALKKWGEKHAVHINTFKKVKNNV